MLSVRKRQVGGGGRGSEGEAGCSLLKRQVGKRSANEKHASRFPFWNTIANHGAQYPISSFKEDRAAVLMEILRISIFIAEDL